MSSTDSEVRKLDLSKIRVNDKYQRPAYDPVIKRIVKGFEPALAGVLEVAPDGEGGFFVVDGQHRLLAMRQLGITEWYAKIDDLTEAEQAAAFVKLQTQRRGVSPLDRHKALLAAGDRAAVDIETVLSVHRLRLARNEILGDKTERGVRTIQSVYNMHKFGGLNHVGRVVGVIARAWPDESTKDSFQRAVVLGVDGFFRNFPLADDHRLIEKLKTVSPNKLARDAQALGLSGAQGGLTLAVVRGLVDVYNHSLRAENRLVYPTQRRNATENS